MNAFHKTTFNKTSKDRRQKVLEVAMEEFAANGYNAASINEVARKSNISIGAMYSYFASKEDLFLSIVHHAYALMDSILGEVVASSKDIFDCVERMVAASRSFAQEYPLLNQIYLDITTQGLSPMSVRLSRELEDITPRILSAMIKKAKSEGKVDAELDEGVASFCIDNILMMYQFSFSSDYYKERMKIYLGEENLNDQAKVEAQIVRFIKAAISPFPK